MAKLTEKQKRFVAEYLVDLNATQAAIRAGYSKKTARSQGQRLLTKVDVQNYLKKRGESVERDLIASADEILRYFTRVMRREETEHVVVTIKTKKSRYDKAGKKVVEEKEKSEVVQIPSKLSDSNKAAEQLGKRLALWDGSGKERENNGVLEALVSEMERRRNE